NVGYFTLRAADFLVNQNPHADFQVTLVEGSPSVYKTLQYRVANQTVLKDKIMLLHGLVGELQGEAKILESAFHVMNSVTSNINSKGATVPYINLNSVYSKISQIDLLKCDIEGSEQRFIENHQELLQKVKTAVFEFHPNKCDLNKCIFELQKVGLVTYKILRKCPDFEVYLFERQ
ncbi:MAG TPA: hypothetical protein DCL61_07670, partial [Cyanobacteria bacterium UBA12227]|nr:hypothetical protein [Cyanobacteria bacterium UBA12227]